MEERKLTFIQAFVLSFPAPTLPPYQKLKNYDYQKESVCPLKESGEEELERITEWLK